MNHHYPPKPTRPGVLFSYERNVREALIRGRSGASAHARISDTTAGVFVNPAPQPKRGGSPGVSTQRFRITSVAGDYITGRLYPDVAGNVDVFIAKPLMLRRSTWHGVTRDGFTYSAAAGDAQLRSLTGSVGGADSSCEEALFPSYKANDHIKAFQPTGGTGVTVNGAELVWEDCNNDARTFMAPYKLRRVCINGVWRYVLRREGEPFGNPA